MEQWLSNTWTSIKAWFLNSETIFLARLQVLVGVVVGFVGAIDWSQLSLVNFGTDFNTTQMLSIAAMMVINGVVTEVARRRNSDLT